METPGMDHLTSSATNVGGAVNLQLPQPLRQEMETSLGADLSAVNIYESHAPTLLNAQAFTQGTDIYFAPGQFEPNTPAGKELLAHELTHVVQQRQGQIL